MSRLPVVDFKTMEKLLHRLGFIAVRQKGSHVFYSKRRTVMPKTTFMNIDMSMIDPIMMQALRLPVLAKVRLMEQLMVVLEQDLINEQAKQPLLSWNGLWADLGSAPSAEEIDAMRSEAWADFPSCCSICPSSAVTIRSHLLGSLPFGEKDIH